jgi:hypothetical protein
MTKRANRIRDVVRDLVSNFFFYDRKEDKYLPRGSIEAALDANEITVDEILNIFRTAIAEYWTDTRAVAPDPVESSRNDEPTLRGMNRGARR